MQILLNQENYYHVLSTLRGLESSIMQTLEQREGKYEEALRLLNTMIAAKGENRQLSPSQYAMLYVARAGEMCIRDRY